MGSELVRDSQPLMGGDNAPLSMTEQFYELLPFYLAIGMSCGQYWEGDCELVKYYRKADELRKQRRNQEMWLQGAYFYEALLDASPILHAFVKEGTKPVPYPAEPFPITQEELSERKQAEEQKAYENKKAKFLAWATTRNKEVKGNG